MASGLSREHNRLRSILDLHDLISQKQSQLIEAGDLIDDEEFADTAKAEVDRLNEQISSDKKDLLLAMLPIDPDEGRNTIVEIRAGAGGDEASLFAGDLFRMYCRYAESNGWTTECLSQNMSDSGGFKEVIFIVKGQDVWTRLKFESGVHRVQRVPVTEASGRIHSSTATVAVLPEAKEIEIEIDNNDLEISVCRASGPGGQGVNTTDSAVQLLHKPSGITVYCADERSQLKNKNKAMTVLRSRLLKISKVKKRNNMQRRERIRLGPGTVAKELGHTIFRKVE